MNRLSIEDRFWPKVDRRGPKECWPWKTGKGWYGSMKVDGVTHPAPRISWALHNGPVPDGLYVCHRCDEPGCVNPAHLFLGTPGDNMRDMVAKKRHRPAGYDNDVPPPKPRAQKIKERLEAMPPDHSILIVDGESPAHSVRSIVTRLRVVWPKRAYLTAKEGNGIRVWRVK